MAAWQKGNLAAAQDYLAHAYELAPTMPVVANNMALILALGGRPDPVKALNIAQSLVEKYPDQPDFRDTRGQILVQLGRYEEAVKDLEYAAPKLKNPAATHLALAEAYGGLNRWDEAQHQKQLAQ